MTARTRTRTEPEPSELAAVIADIHKHKGDMTIRPASQLIPFNHLPTGAFTMDFALMGGILEGLATMIYGWESSGKTTMANRLVSSAQHKYPDAPL